jgi:hypothetical protein
MVRGAAIKANRGSEVRKRALVRVACSSILAAFLFWFLAAERARGRTWLGPGLAAPLLPLVYFLAELVTGRRVPDLARDWDALKGWQRGVLGCGIVAAIFVLLFVVLMTVGDAW